MHNTKPVLAAMCLVLTSPLAAAENNAKKSAWSMEIEAGLGYDSNAYLAPSDSYVDYAPATPISVNPVKHSGVFIPLGVDVDYNGRGERDRGLIMSYSFDGNYYPGSETKNANEYNTKLKGGMEFLLNQQERREDTLSITPYFGIHSKTYFNRDTGDQMVSSVSGTDLSDRYSYSVIGLEVELKHDTSRIPYSLHTELARRDYVDPSSAAFDSYDHDYFRIGGDVDFPIAKPTKLQLSYDYYTRKFDEWRARDLSGNYNTAGIAREYTYHKAGVSLRQKFTDEFVLYLEYDLTDRKDNYVGYHDYRKNSYGLRAIYDKDKVRLKAKAVWWERDYDIAFAFDNPTQPEMTYKATEYSIKGDYDLTKNRSLWAELKSVDQKSTDLRYQYDRYQVMAGWRWEK
jgi:hypothetical protein